MELWTFLFAVLVLELTPVPNMAYLAILALARGRIAGLVATAGVATGLAVHAVVAGLGAGALIQQYPLLYETLRWIGVGYLLYLGGGRRRKLDGRRRNHADAGALFMRGFLSNVFNPKSILFFVSVLPRFVGPSPTILQYRSRWSCSAFFMYVAVATGVHASIVTLAAQLRPWLIEGPRQQIVRRILWCWRWWRSGWRGARGAERVEERCNSSPSSDLSSSFSIASASSSAPAYSVIGTAAGLAQDHLWLSFTIGAGVALLTALSYAEMATYFQRPVRSMSISGGHGRGRTGLPSGLAQSS